MLADEDDVTTTKPALHDAAESDRMPADKDKVTTPKHDPHDTTESGRMPGQRLAVGYGQGQQLEAVGFGNCQKAVNEIHSIRKNSAMLLHCIQQ